MTNHQLGHAWQPWRVLKELCGDLLIDLGTMYALQAFQVMSDCVFLNSRMQTAKALHFSKFGTFQVVFQHFQGNPTSGRRGLHHRRAQRQPAPAPQRAAGVPRCTRNRRGGSAVRRTLSERTRRAGDLRALMAFWWPEGDGWTRCAFCTWVWPQAFLTAAFALSILGNWVAGMST